MFRAAFSQGRIGARVMAHRPYAAARSLHQTVHLAGKLEVKRA